MLILLIITKQKQRAKTNLNAFLKVVNHLKNNFSRNLIEQLGVKFKINPYLLQLLIDEKMHANEYWEQDFKNEGGWNL